MKVISIKFVDPGDSYCIGRGGEVNCGGVELVRRDDAFKRVFMSATDGDGKPIQALIAFPLAEVDNVIAALTSLKVK